MKKKSMQSPVSTCSCVRDLPLCTIQHFPESWSTKLQSFIFTSSLRYRENQYQANYLPINNKSKSSTRLNIYSLNTPQCMCACVYVCVFMRFLSCSGSWRRKRTDEYSHTVNKSSSSHPLRTRKCRQWSRQSGWKIRDTRQREEGNK